MFDYRIVRTSRKTICVSVTAIGEIIVRVPKKCADKEIIAFVTNNSAWINSKISKAHNTMPDIISLKSLEYIYILGEKLYIENPIAFKTFNDSKIIKKIFINENKLYLPDGNNRESKLINFLKKYASEYLKKRCAEIYSKYKASLQNEFSDIKIINSKAKWGACDNKKVLYFNWRAIMLERNLIDYLICHELCHLVHMNHSKEYWATVGLFTDYKKYRKLLKEKNYLILLYRK